MVMYDRIVVAADGNKMSEWFLQKQSKAGNYLSVNYIIMSTIKRSRRIKRNKAKQVQHLAASSTFDLDSSKGRLPRFCVMPFYHGCIDFTESNKYRRTP